MHIQLSCTDLGLLHVILYMILTDITKKKKQIMLFFILNFKVK